MGAHSVWTANAGEGTVSQIDPKELRVVQTIGLGLAATDLVEARGVVWVATGSDNNIVRIDARSGGVLARAKLSQDDLASAYAVAAGDDAVWVGSGSDIFKIDSSSHELVGRWHYGGGDQRSRRRRRLRMVRQQRGDGGAALGDDRPSDWEDDASESYRQRLRLAAAGSGLPPRTHAVLTQPSGGSTRSRRGSPRRLSSERSWASRQRWKSRSAKEQSGSRATTPAQSPDSIL